VIQVSLRQEDAKLTYLAIAYHLGRPGSELDPTTKLPVEHGLAETAQTLQPQLRMAVATISLRDNQLSRLQSAIFGTITELKAYPMLQPRQSADGSAGRRSTVPGFDATLQHLFPEVEDDPESSLDIAERMLLFKRSLDERVAGLPREPDPHEEPTKQQRGWWPFGRNR
jgi:hypothetical protein